MTVTGPDFIALQVSDLERSAEFYENALGLRRAPASPPGAVLFTTTPIPFAVREPCPELISLRHPVPVSGWHSGCTATRFRNCTTRSRPQEQQSWPILFPAPSA